MDVVEPFLVGEADGRTVERNGPVVAIEPEQPVLDRDLGCRRLLGVPWLGHPGAPCEQCACEDCPAMQATTAIRSATHHGRPTAAAMTPTPIAAT